MARWRPPPEPDRSDEEAAMQLTWARYCARVGGLLRRPDDPLLGGPDAEAYDALSAEELRELAEARRDSGASERVLYHLRLAEEADQ